MHMPRCLFNLITALHVSGVTITHLQEHKTTVTTASGNLYTVLLSATIVEELEPVWVCCGWRTETCRAVVRLNKHRGMCILLGFIYYNFITIYGPKKTKCIWIAWYMILNKPSFVKLRSNIWGSLLLIKTHICFVCFGRDSPKWVMASSFTRFLDRTQRRTTIGRTPLDEWSARRRDLYLTRHNTHNRQISMPPAGFEPTVSAGERPQTYALDRAATGTG
jgi:hypothetical protein